MCPWPARPRPHRMRKSFRIMPGVRPARGPTAGSIRSCRPSLPRRQSVARPATDPSHGVAFNGVDVRVVLSAACPATAPSQAGGRLQPGYRHWRCPRLGRPRPHRGYWQPEGVSVELPLSAVCSAAAPSQASVRTDCHARLFAVCGPPGLSPIRRSPGSCPDARPPELSAACHTAAPSQPRRRGSDRRYACTRPRPGRPRPNRRGHFSASNGPVLVGCPWLAWPRPHRSRTGIFQARRLAGALRGPSGRGPIAIATPVR